MTSHIPSDIQIPGNQVMRKIPTKWNTRYHDERAFKNIKCVTIKTLQGNQTNQSCFQSQFSYIPTMLGFLCIFYLLSNFREQLLQLLNFFLIFRR